MKTFELKSAIELIEQNTYEKNKKNTIHNRTATCFDPEPMYFLSSENIQKVVKNGSMWSIMEKSCDFDYFVPRLEAIYPNSPMYCF